MLQSLKIHLPDATLLLHFFPLIFFSAKHTRFKIISLHFLFLGKLLNNKIPLKERAHVKIKTLYRNVWSYNK